MEEAIKGMLAIGRAQDSLGDDTLIHLKSYKYSSVDNSYLTHYVLRHYWNWGAEFLPKWLAPNMVTLIGFFFILGNVVLMEVFMPELIGPAPTWVYYSFAFGMFMYQTMDNLDGKQARRTGQSSGLGELFDHGIDSLNCTLASLLETAAVSMGGRSGTSLFTAMVPCLPMYFSTWETYHTHTLYLGYFNGPTEGLIIACLVIIAAGIWGPEIYHTPLLPLLPESLASALTSVVPSALLDSSSTMIDIWIPWIMTTFFIFHLPECVSNVVRARRARNLPIAPVFVEWVPFIVYVSSTNAWLMSPHSTLLRDNHLVLFCITQSFVFGRMTTKIILAHLLRQSFPYWTVLIIPLVIGAVLANLPQLTFNIFTTSPFETPGWELLYLRIYLVFAAMVYFRWAAVVIKKICDYLDINALTITPRLLPKKEGGRGESIGGKANGRAEVEVDDAEQIVWAGRSLRNRTVADTPRK